MEINTYNVIESLMRHGFDADEVSREFGYDNRKSFQKAVKRVTGQTWTETLESASGRKPMETNETASDTSFIEAKCAEAGINPDDVSVFWRKDEESSILVKRPKQEVTEKTYFDVRDQIIAEMKEYAPKYRRHQFKPGEHLFVVASTDFHVGKLAHAEETGEDYNISIAVNRIRKAISELSRKASVFGIDRILFILGSDALHVDNTINTTTNGTYQDADGRWFRAFDAAKKLYIGIIEELTLIAPVELVFNPGNHDRMSGWMLADTVASWFSSNPNVNTGEMGKSLSVSPRKYHAFGRTLIGTCHGDCREKDLAMTMAFEASSVWDDCKYRYWITGDKHHISVNAYGKNGVKNVAKEQTAVTVLKANDPTDEKSNVYVNIVKSPSANDSWHSRSLYMSLPGINGFVFSPTEGQVAMLTQPV